MTATKLRVGDKVVVTDLRTGKIHRGAEVVRFDPAHPRSVIVRFGGVGPASRVGLSFVRRDEGAA